MSLSRTELKKVRALQSGKGRRAGGLFSAEGIRLLEEALRFGRLPTDLYYAPSVLSERGSALVKAFAEKGIRQHAVSAGDLSRMSGVKTSQGVVGIFPIPSRSLSKLYVSTMRSILVCENLSDPGNVGTLGRSALAFDFDMMVLLGRSADPYSPKTVRASMGAVFGLPVAMSDSDELLELAASEEFDMIAAAPTGKDRLSSILTANKPERLMLAVGSEAEGLSEAMLSAARWTVRIDHNRRVESLNSAVAGSILLKECYDLRVRRQQ